MALAFVAPALSQDLSRLPTKKRPSAAKKSDQIFTGYNFNFGSHTEFYNAVQEDTSGSLRRFDWAPTIGGGLIIPWKEKLVFLPELNWVLPRDNGDTNVLENLFMLRADLGYDPLEWLRLRIGTSLMWLNQHGQGGSVKMNNGNETSTFYYPDENRSSVNNTFDLGVEALYSNWALRLQTYTYFIFREEKRQLSYTLFLTYYWDR
jgi:hypothetical protein